MTATIDAADVHLVAGHNWNFHRKPSNTYATRREKNGRVERRVYLHQVICGPAPSGWVIDHINGDGLDNRRSNLRLVPTFLNNRNRRRARGSAHPAGENDYGKPIIRYRRRDRKYRVYASLGLYETLEEAQHMLALVGDVVLKRKTTPPSRTRG